MNILLLSILNNLILSFWINSPFGMILKFDEEYVIIWVLYIFLTILPFMNFWTINYYQSIWGLYILYKLLFNNVYYVLDNIVLSSEIIKDWEVRSRKFLPFIILSQYVLFLLNLIIRDWKIFIGYIFAKINYIFECLKYSCLKIILGYIYIIGENMIKLSKPVKCNYDSKSRSNRYIDRIFSYIEFVSFSNFVIFETNLNNYKHVG